MGIEAAPQCLTWSGNEDEWLTVYHEFLTTVSTRLGRVLLALESEAPEEVARIKTCLAVAPDAVFTRFVTAPEVTNRLLWRRPSEESARFLADTFEAELAACGPPAARNAATRWSALGDFHVSDTGQLHWPYRIDDFPPIDFGSPHAENMARSEGFVEVGTPETRGFSMDETEEQVAALVRTRDAIASTSSEAHRFVVTFNRVLILQRDPGAPEGFASGSTGQYIGRSFISNPQLDFVDEAQLADAIVHEGIHGYLYMLELNVPWVLRPDLYETTPAVYSPWTGNHLAVRPFLQACFVWFGLANFFARAFTQRTLPRARAYARLRIAATGFLKDELVSLVERYDNAISPEILSAIQSMQTTIREAYND
jgi:HEXXH motif-containing protein